jgi:hypothetical protein
MCVCCCENIFALVACRHIPIPDVTATMTPSSSAQPRPLPGPAVIGASSVHGDDPNRRRDNAEDDPDSSTATTAHPILHPHRLPHRRFIGPLPESVLNSTEVEEAKRWYESLRETLRRQEHDDQGRDHRDHHRRHRNGDDAGDWTDQGPSRNPVRKVGQIGRAVGEHVRHPLHPHQRTTPNASDGHSLFAESYMTDETRQTNLTADTNVTSTNKSNNNVFYKLGWRKKDSRPRRPNVWHGESFDIGSSFRPLRTVSCASITASNGSGSNVRCFKRYGGLIDVDDEYLTPSDEEDNGEDAAQEGIGKGTIYGSPKSMSLADGEGDGRPGLSSRGTGTTVQSFQTARTHQPSSKAAGTGMSTRTQSFQTARTHQPASGPSTGTSNSLFPPPFDSRTTSTSMQTTQTGDFHSAYSSIPAPSILDTDPPDFSTQTHRAGSSSTADHGSTRRLIPPATGVTYDTSRQSDHSANHIGVPPVQPELGDRQKEEEAMEVLKGRRSSAPGSGLGLRGSGGKLKSALKFRHRAVNEEEHDHGSTTIADGVDGVAGRPEGFEGLPGRPPAKKTKTVQFPVGRDLDDRGSESISGLRTRWRGLRDRLRDDDGDDDDDGDGGEEDDGDGKSDHSLEPADPREVLARTGPEVVGTSAGVVEAHRGRPDPSETPTDVVDPAVNLSTSRDPRKGKDKGKGKDKAMGNCELGLDPTVETEMEAHPDAVVLRDRMLVRVGKSKERGLAGYDEAMSRRRPCSRLDRMEGGSTVARMLSVMALTNVALTI